MRTPLILIIIAFISTSFTNTQIDLGSELITHTWTWEKSYGGANGDYTATPKSLGISKKISFTDDGNVITYKDNVEIRNSTYEIKKGISVFDNKEHDLLTFEGITYVIENVDNHSLILTNNTPEGFKSIYKR